MNTDTVHRIFVQTIKNYHYTISLAWSAASILVIFKIVILFAFLKLYCICIHMSSGSVKKRGGFIISLVKSDKKQKHTYFAITCCVLNDIAYPYAFFNKYISRNCFENVN